MKANLYINEKRGPFQDWMQSRWVGIAIGLLLVIPFAWAGYVAGPVRDDWGAAALWLLFGYPMALWFVMGERYMSQFPDNGL